MPPDADHAPLPPVPAGRRPYTATSGALLAAAPVPWAVAAWAHAAADTTMPTWAFVAAAVESLALVLAGLTLSSAPRPGRLLATAGTIGVLATAAPRLVDAPALALLLAMATLIGVGPLWQLGTPFYLPDLQRTQPLAGRVRGAATLAAVFWLFVGVADDRSRPAVTLAVAASMLLAAAIGASWLVQRHRTQSARTRTVAAALAVSLVLAIATHDDAWSLASAGAVYACITSVFGPRTEQPDARQGRWWTTLFEHPERLLVSTFATMAAVGAIVLAMPESTRSGVSIGGMDAAFTAISAVCVTGLVVRDTPVEFAALGQGTLLVLMQLGGLGIMTFSTAALRVLGGRMSLRQESAVARVIGAKDRSTLVASAQDVLRITFVVEAAGALLLTALFHAHGDGLGEAAWRGVFTAVSAFCNAGFALQSDSLVPFQQAPFVLHTVAALIVLGGLSPAVLLALATRRGKARPLAAQVRICLTAAAALLAVGFVLILFAEWDRSLAGLSVLDKAHNAWFQSVTLRTAGFNSVDLTVVHPATWALMLCLMFVGGSPGGTAGGVKTTTVALLLLSAMHTIRGSGNLTVYGRRVPDRTVQRAAVVVTVAVTSGFVALLALLLTQDMPVPVAVFEVVSALGTVGLSQGGTALLDDVGKIVVMACMFVGRIGGLSIMMFMSQRTTQRPVILPSEDVDVG